MRYSEADAMECKNVVMMTNIEGSERCVCTIHVIDIRYVSDSGHGLDPSSWFLLT